jgi:hypothetical protein
MSWLSKGVMLLWWEFSSRICTVWWLLWYCSHSNCHKDLVCVFFVLVTCLFCFPSASYCKVCDATFYDADGNVLSDKDCGKNIFKLQYNLIHTSQKFDSMLSHDRHAHLHPQQTSYQYKKYAYKIFMTIWMATISE